MLRTDIEAPEEQGPEVRDGVAAEEADADHAPMRIEDSSGERILQQGRHLHQTLALAK